MSQDPNAKFADLERRFMSCGQNIDQKTLDCLNQAIQLADEILEALKYYQGITGMVKSQTLLYLALSLNRRANLHWFRGYEQEIDPQVNCQKAIDDLDRAESLNNRWNLSVSIDSRMRCLCYLELQLFDKALTEAQKLCEKTKNTDNFLLLSHVFDAFGNYNSAMEAATEAMRYARNESERKQVITRRKAINAKLGNAN